MAQTLLPLVNQYKLDLKPYVVERLPADCYPAPARYEAWSIVDAQQLAAHLGLAMPKAMRVPDRLSVQMAALHLSRLENVDQFLKDAVQLGRLVWTNDQAGIRQICQMADMDDDQIRAGEAALANLGGFASGTVAYQGNLYTGVDRLRHFISDYVGAKNMAQNPFVPLQDDVPSLETKKKSGTLNVYFSLSCPYSYLMLKRLEAIANSSSLSITLNPVTSPTVPPRKWRYMLVDCAREAEVRGIPFLTGPLTLPTEMMVLGTVAKGETVKSGLEQLAYYTRQASQIWAGGSVGAGNAVPPERISSIQQKLEANTKQLRLAGLWGTPSIVVKGVAYWGQDRLDLALSQLQS